MKLFIAKKRGFTLIEMAVVMGVFLFIIGAAISIFISVVQNQKKVLAEQQLINQVSYVEEYMSKALRMAAADTAGNCIPLGTGGVKYIYSLTRYDSEVNLFRGIVFYNQSSGDCQEFFLDPTNSAYPVLKELKGALGTRNNDIETATAITSTNLQITDLKFAINGSNGSVGSTYCPNSSLCAISSADPVQPKVTMLFKIKVAGDPQDPIRTIQTTVSQRNLNVK